MTQSRILSCQALPQDNPEPRQAPATREAIFARLQTLAARLGTALPATAAGSPDAPDDLAELVSLVGRLLADQEAQEAELRALHADLANQKFALDQHAIVSMTDLLGTITYVNDRFCQISGYNRAELIGANHRIIRSDEHSCAFFTDLWATIQAGSIWRGEIKNRKKNGDHYWVSSTIVPLKDSRGLPASYIAIRTDITERKQAELELITAKAAADAANRAKSQFLANMSHEIRTPLNAILGLAELLEADISGVPEREMLGNIRAAGRSLLGILNDILDFSRIEAGELRIDPQPFALQSLLTQISHLMLPMARAKGIAWRIEAAPPEREGLDLVGDSLRIEQVLVNLAGNAIKFTNQGEVCLRVKPLEDPSGGLGLRFEVQDTGIGMDAETLGRLFTPFSQGETGTSRRFGGTGLGLSICKRLVNLMGGRIGVESLPGRGSTFWFELALDLAPRVGPGPGPLPVPAGHRLAGARILVADDSQVNLDLIARFLEREGALPMLAGDGQQALNRLLAEPQGFDAVLMDMRMPVMDGFAATRLIRARPELGQLPVIAFTAGVLREEQRLMFDVGVNDFVPKPVEFAYLAGVLARWLDRGPPRPAKAEKTEATAKAAPAGDPGPFPRIAGIDEPHAQRQFEGDARFFIEVLASFAASLEPQLAAILASLEAGDRPTAKAALHKLRGSAGNIGALELAGAARLLEDALATGMEAEIPGLAAAFQALAEDLRLAIRPWVATPGGPGPTGGPGREACQP